MNSGQKLKHTRIKEKPQYIQVFARVRPQNTLDKQRGPPVVHCDKSEVTVKDRQDQKTMRSFFFDRVFDENSTQMEVYNHVVKPAIEDILKGFNYTVFAYGQSGSGKTYTIVGDRSSDPDISWDNDPACGLIPHAVIHLFNELRVQKGEFTLRVSHLELCNEEMTDLLARTGNSSKLRLYEDGSRKGAVCVHGLEEEVLHTRRDLHNILQKFLAQRTSSRSHSIFTCTVHIKENSVDGDDLVRMGKLCLVDLAASECGTRASAADKGAREPVSANQSLLTLGRVITALVQRAPHVPYRESKLTRLLKDALSGRCRTSIIGTVFPTAANVEETVSVLEYVQRARNIAVNPELNPKLTKESLIKEYMEEIEQLKRDLEACRTKQGVYLLNEDYTEMISNTTKLDHEISEKLCAIRCLNEQLQDKRRLCEELGVKLEETKAQVALGRGRLQAQLNCRDETQHLLERHQRTEEGLSQQAGALLRVVDETSSHLCALHAKVDRFRRITCENDDKRRELGSEFSKGMEALEQDMAQCLHTFKENTSGFRESVCTALEGDVSIISSISEKFVVLAKNHLKHIRTVEEIVDKMAADAKYLVDDAAATNLTAAASDTTMQDYLQNMFPCIRGVITCLQKRTADIVDIFKDLECKNMKEAAWIAESLNKQRESNLRIRKEFLEEVERRRTEKQKIYTLIQNVKKSQSCSSKALLAMLAETQTAVRNTRLQGTEYQEALAGASKCFMQEAEIAAVANESILDSLNLQETSDKQLLCEMKGHREQLVAQLEDALEQVQLATTQMQEGLNTAVENVDGLSAASMAAWVNRREQMQAVVSTLSERVSAGLQEEERVAGEACEASGEQIRACVVQTGQLQHQASASIDTLVKQLESQSADISSLSSRMTASLQRASEEMSLIAEDYVKDQPSGNTPERKEYQFPQKLIATSPHDKIIEEFRISRRDVQSNLDFLNSSTEEEGEPDQEEGEACALPCTPSVEERFFPRSETSSTGAVFGSEPDLVLVEDKENAHEAQTSRLPVKLVHSASKASSCKQILSPRN